ncbi:uncharacterized protein LOC126212743 [Schistocerca nitens]|uniref:uncharacterized protein LOC126212743 n=1 Tax=Schistocerca nitens TaxID=7011 RepID=UPI00211895AE|nr:uncharacterized protein LOC126212743 [Schistocerca nitens]
MDSKGTSWLKKEKIEVYAEQGSLFPEDPLKIVMTSLHIKQDLELKQEDGIERDFPEDPLKIVMTSLHIKQDLELKQEDGIERDFPEDPLKIVMTSLHIKQDLELKQEDGIERDFPEDPLKIVMTSLHIKQDLELKQEDGIERDCLEDNLGISHPNDFIKEDPEQNLEVAASIRKTSDSLRNKLIIGGFKNFYPKPKVSSKTKKNPHGKSDWKSLDVATVQDLKTHCIAVLVVARLAQSSWSHGPTPPAEGDQQPTDEEGRGGALAVVRSITWISGWGLCGGLACLVAADCTNPCSVHGTYTTED